MILLNSVLLTNFYYAHDKRHVLFCTEWLRWKTTRNENCPGLTGVKTHFLHHLKSVHTRWSLLWLAMVDRKYHDLCQLLPPNSTVLFTLSHFFSFLQISSQQLPLKCIVSTICATKLLGLHRKGKVTDTRAHNMWVQSTNSQTLLVTCTRYLRWSCINCFEFWQHDRHGYILTSPFFVKTSIK